MINLKRFILLPSILAGLMILSSYSFAGAADLTNKDGTKMKFEYQGDNLRINTGQGDESYMLLRDDHMYVVSNANGEIMVIDMNQAMSMFGGMAGAATPSVVASEVVTLEATGRHEKQAGIDGEVYNLRYIAEDGKEHRTELLLSDDPRARALSRAMNRMALTLAISAGKNYADATNDMETRLGALEMGVLRYGDDMVVSAISDRKIDPSRFVLPAEPTELPNFSNMMKQMGQSSSTGETKPGTNENNGGVVSSFLGALGKLGKKPESDEQNKDSPDQPAEEEEEKNKENAFGKVFGKLFGD